jgi:penicillin-binding protein 2
LFWLQRLCGRVFHCWEPEGHGYIDLLNAIKVSCNVYFYRLGLKTGVVEWALYAEQFGFGKLTQIDLAEENRGILPDKSYLDKKYGRRGWSRGTIVNLAVGQGDLIVTPIQMAKMVAIIATDGRSVQPHVVRSFQDPLSGNWEDLIPNIERGVKISTPVFMTLKTGMSMVVNMPKGTGRYAQVTGVNVCGKTGTAQNPHGEPHAWFVGFAPKESPRVAIVVFLENAGSGGSVAAPVAGSILQWFFSREIVS